MNLLGMLRFQWHLPNLVREFARKNCQFLGRAALGLSIAQVSEGLEPDVLGCGMSPSIEKQIEKKMEHALETGPLYRLIDLRELQVCG